jgi:threonine dehydrogenase-like Zn-dependent dehydrogenase
LPNPARVRCWYASVPSGCGSDVHYDEHGRIGPYVVDAPMVIGHEASGEITAVGEGVVGDRIGSLVALEPGVPCRNCLMCLSGHYNLCRDVEFFATPPVDGSICDSMPQVRSTTVRRGDLGGRVRFRFASLDAVVVKHRSSHDT